MKIIKNFGKILSKILKNNKTTNHIKQPFKKIQINWDKISKKVLDENQRSLKPFLEYIFGNGNYFLVGGTAIALQIGHRKSIDFDIFTLKHSLSSKQIFYFIEKSGLKNKFDIQKSNLRYLEDIIQPEIILFLNNVKIQIIDFSRNPFNEKINLKANITLHNGIPSLDLKTLGALKCYALMYRNKWKDIVDLYFILKQGYNLRDLLNLTKNIFGKLYKKESTVETIIDWKWNKTENIDWLLENPPIESEIKNYILEQIKSL